MEQENNPGQGANEAENELREAQEQPYEPTPATTSNSLADALAITAIIVLGVITATYWVASLG